MLGPRPLESEPLADAQRMPALGKLIELVDDLLESFAQHACGFELLLPVARQRLAPAPCLPALLENLG